MDGWIEHRERKIELSPFLRALVRMKTGTLSIYYLFHDCYVSVMIKRCVNGDEYCLKNIIHSITHEGMHGETYARLDRWGLSAQACYYDKRVMEMIAFCMRESAHWKVISVSLVKYFCQ